MTRNGWMMAGVAAVWLAGSVAVVWAEDQKPAGDANAPAASTNIVKQTMCPVMNQPINKALYVDTDGKRIYVCCPMCIKTIKKDPAKYVKMLEDKGITLDKAEPAKAPSTDAKDEGGGCGCCK